MVCLIALQQIRHDSPPRHAERTVWQRRYWEHAIRNEEDLRRHIDYIHFNPVKHGLAAEPGEWSYSTYRSFVEKGFYQEKRLSEQSVGADIEWE